jgi:hypothetical protein
MIQTNIVISDKDLMAVRSAVKVFNTISPIPMEVIKESRINDHIINIDLNHFNMTDIFKLGQYAERMKL